GRLRTAEVSEVAPWLCIRALLITTIDCGMSCGSPPTRCSDDEGGVKSSLGREPVTVTGAMVAGAPLGWAGVLWAGWPAGCCACAAAVGAMARPARTPLTGTRRLLISKSPSASPVA